MILVRSFLGLTFKDFYPNQGILISLLMILLQSILQICALLSLSPGTFHDHVAPCLRPVA